MYNIALHRAVAEFSVFYTFCGSRGKESLLFSITKMSENKKRKRTKNTTNEQYELYLELMESDYAFRSNTINPTLPPHYLQDKWEELALKLNAIGDDGPILTAEEWKKRFTDWKYATKAKARKIDNYKNKTGGGPSTELKLSNLEERALNVWGRVTIEGARIATEYEGILFPVPSSDQSIVENVASNEDTEEYETILLNVENESLSTEKTGPQPQKQVLQDKDYQNHYQFWQRN